MVLVALAPGTMAVPSEVQSCWGMPPPIPRAARVFNLQRRRLSPAIDRIGKRNRRRCRLFFSSLGNQQANQAEAHHQKANSGPDNGNAKQKTAQQQECARNTH